MRGTKKLARKDRRGQMEMIGLVFVVVIIVIGIVLYVKFSNKVDPSVKVAKNVEAYTSFLAAFSETDIPACSVSGARIPAGRVAQACAEQDMSFCNGHPCEQLKQAMETVAAATLHEQGVRYNFSMEGGGEPIEVIEDCNSGLMRTGVYERTWPAGPGTLHLSICLT